MVSFSIDTLKRIERNGFYDEKQNKSVENREFYRDK